jgi:hypothetical protein
MAKYYMDVEGLGLKPISAALYNVIVSGTSVISAFSSDQRMKLRLSENIVVETRGERAKEFGDAIANAPKAAIVLLSAVFKDGRALLIDWAKAIVEGETVKNQAVLADAEKTLAEAAISRATARKTDAEADKIFAETEQIRAATQRFNEAIAIARNKELLAIAKEIDGLKPQSAKILRKKFDESLRSASPVTPQLPPPLG